MALGTIIFACIPVEASWKFELAATAHCYPKTTFTKIGLFNSCVNIITDVVFAIIPIPILWGLQINIRTRLTLTAILGLGYFACACAIVKAILQTKVLSSPDYTFHDSYFVWNAVELYVGILAASLPALRPLFISLLETAHSLRSRNGRSGLPHSNSRHKYYMQENSVGMHPMPSSRPSVAQSRYGGSVRVFGESRASEDYMSGWKTRSNSDDAIIPPQYDQDGQINLQTIEVVKTVNVTIS
ncbi:hypothetical protein BP5796_01924 [Coleophoma crateriformis]|uniref:Rhodopsin domain-containing protein n=1 Tax=Coleophoma crateriformis TaxID=565419 RepID=A0A3D8T1X4_9HELO|nr:hypothetical protein BP5796_01924 [Coleophoma crateriformis]